MGMTEIERVISDIELKVVAVLKAQERDLAYIHDNLHNMLKYTLLGRAVEGCEIGMTDSEKEPHVMTVSEIGALDNGCVVWVEFSDGQLLPMMVEDGCLMRWRYLWRICEDAFYDDDYRARAWTSRPTKEQMEATAWD